MTKILSLDEMLECANLAKMPGAAEAIRTAELLATDLAERLARHFDITCGAASFQGVDLGGTAAPFMPKESGQACPAFLADYDPTEWSVRPQWHPQDVGAACLDGWRLSERADGFYEIQREDAATLFATDAEAQAHVAAKAANGASLYRRAFYLDGKPVKVA